MQQSTPSGRLLRVARLQAGIKRSFVQAVLMGSHDMTPCMPSPRCTPPSQLIIELLEVFVCTCSCGWLL